MELEMRIRATLPRVAAETGALVAAEAEVAHVDPVAAEMDRVVAVEVDRDAIFHNETEIHKMHSLERAMKATGMCVLITMVHQAIATLMTISVIVFAQVKKLLLAFLLETKKTITMLMAIRTN